MIQNLIKESVLWSIARGFSLPQNPVERVNELSFLKSLLQQLQIDCVLDVGANRGQFAQELRKIGYQGRIVSFEPLRAEFQTMSKLMQGDKNWLGFNMAMGDADEQKDIIISGNTLYTSFLEPAFETQHIESQNVQVRRLDTFLPEVLPELQASRVFLKMDTQGYDLRVFAGASGVKGCIRGIESELSIQPIYQDMPHYLEALRVYEAAGFELFNLSVVNRIESGGLLELNCFMRRPEQTVSTSQ